MVQDTFCQMKDTVSWKASTYINPQAAKTAAFFVQGRRPETGIHRSNGKKTLDISADDCIFQDGHDRTGSTYQALLRLLPLCDEKSLSALEAAATVLTGADQDAMSEVQSGN